jgi:hypothetical protein
MCKRAKFGNQRIDPCMRETIQRLKSWGFETLACCCGHGIYPETIVIKDPDFGPIEIYSHTEIPRKCRFYKRDTNGVFFIPEVQSLHAQEKSVGATA